MSILEGKKVLFRRFKIALTIMIEKKNENYIKLFDFFNTSAGIKWIKEKYGDSLVVTRLGQKNYLDVIERAIASGDVVLLENIEETVDPVLDPLLGRNTIKKGRAIKLGDKEIDYSASFR